MCPHPRGGGLAPLHGGVCAPGGARPCGFPAREHPVQTPPQAATRTCEGGTRRRALQLAHSTSWPPSSLPVSAQQSDPRPPLGPRAPGRAWCLRSAEGACVLTGPRGEDQTTSRDTPLFLTWEFIFRYRITQLESLRLFCSCVVENSVFELVQAPDPSHSCQIKEKLFCKMWT